MVPSDLLRRWQIVRLGRTRHSRGFTLPELLVILIVTGVLVAIATPGMLSLANTNRVNAAQDTLFQVFRQAQTQAIRSRVTWDALFREADGRVQWASHPSSTATTSIRWQNFEPGVRIDTGETTLSQQSGIYRMQFNHRGHANGQLGKLTLIGASSGAPKRCVIISTLLGTIRKAREQARADDSGRFCY